MSGDGVWGGIFKKWRAWAVLMLAGGVLAGCSSLTRLYFYPQSEWVRTPADFHLAYDDVTLTVKDGTELHGWWLPAIDDSKEDAEGVGLDMVFVEEASPVVLFLHGNAENISTHIASVAWLPAKGISVFALDYRGFGASTGRPEMPGVLQDIRAGADWLRRTYPDRPLIIFGQSIGAALAVTFVGQSGSDYQVKGLVVEAPFAGFGSVAREALSKSALGWAVWPFTWLVPSDWDPDQWASFIQVPTLVMHSPDDQIISSGQTGSVYESLGGDHCRLPLQGPHIAGMNDPVARRSVGEFIHNRRCSAFTD